MVPRVFGRGAGSVSEYLGPFTRWEKPKRDLGGKVGVPGFGPREDWRIGRIRSNGVEVQRDRAPTTRTPKHRGKGGVVARVK